MALCAHPEPSVQASLADEKLQIPWCRERGGGGVADDSLPALGEAVGGVWARGTRVGTCVCHMCTVVSGEPGCVSVGGVGTMVSREPDCVSVVWCGHGWSTWCMFHPHPRE